jgi:hypothetical protein
MSPRSGQTQLELLTETISFCENIIHSNDCPALDMLGQIDHVGPSKATSMSPPSGSQINRLEHPSILKSIARSELFDSPPKLRPATASPWIPFLLPLLKQPKAILM